MDKVGWKNQKEYLALKEKIRIEIIKEIQQIAGCKKCKKFQKITEKDLIFKEKSR